MNDLIKKYKHKIMPREKSVEELIDYLKHKTDIVEIATTALLESYVKLMIFNIIHCLRNEKFAIPAHEFNFVAYKIIRNHKSNPYYQHDYVHFFDVQEDDFIFVIFETKTGVIHCNSGRLMLELHIEQGVSQYDYDNETLLFIDYLCSLDLYSNGDY
ncbi:hypothetical protein [Desulfoscipio gibsoniae]